MIPLFGCYRVNRQTGRLTISDPISDSVCKLRVLQPTRGVWGIEPRKRPGEAFFKRRARQTRAPDTSMRGGVAHNQGGAAIPRCMTVPSLALALSPARLDSAATLCTGLLLAVVSRHVWRFSTERAWPTNGRTDLAGCSASWLFSTDGPVVDAFHISMQRERRHDVTSRLFGGEAAPAQHGPTVQGPHKDVLFVEVACTNVLLERPPRVGAARTSSSLLCPGAIERRLLLQPPQPASLTSARMFSSSGIEAMLS